MHSYFLCNPYNRSIMLNNDLKKVEKLFMGSANLAVLVLYTCSTVALKWLACYSNTYNYVTMYAKIGHNYARKSILR